VETKVETRGTVMSNVEAVKVASKGQEVKVVDKIKTRIKIKGTVATGTKVKDKTETMNKADKVLVTKVVIKVKAGTMKKAGEDPKECNLLIKRSSFHGKILFVCFKQINAEANNHR
jgi:hypothetical protein